MDLRQFFQKVRQIEESILGEDVVVVSLETSDGGKAGVVAQVKRSVAARLVVEGRARLADPAEAEKFHAEQRQARKTAEEQRKAERVQFTMIAADDLDVLRGSRKGSERAG